MGFRATSVTSARSVASPFLIGEYRRTLDDRFRLSIPAPLIEPLMGGRGECILVKERPGALSLWGGADGSSVGSEVFS